MSERTDLIRTNLCAWQKRGAKLYGPNVALWKFKCPSCGQIQTGEDWKAAGADIRDIDRMLAFSCIGRQWLRLNGLDYDVVEFMEKTKGKGCNYAGHGLFRVAPLEVVYGTNKATGEPETRLTFDFADGFQE